MSEPTIKTGNGGHVTFGGVTYHVAEWKTEESSEMIRITTTASVNNCKESIPGESVLTGSFKIFIDPAAMPTLRTGTFGVLTLKQGTATLYDTVDAWCTGVGATNVAIDALTQEFKFEGTGDFF